MSVGLHRAEVKDSLVKLWLCEIHLQEWNPEFKRFSSTAVLSAFLRDSQCYEGGIFCVFFVSFGVSQDEFFVHAQCIKESVFSD